MNPHVLNEFRCLMGMCVCACFIIIPWWRDRRRLARWRQATSGQVTQQTTKRRSPR